MTNKEAINELSKLYGVLTLTRQTNDALLMAFAALQAQAEKEKPMNITTAIAITKDVMSDYASPITKEALGMAVDALKSKAEKERRYVVHEDSEYGPYRVCFIRDVGTFYYVSNRIKTREAAQAIADIYEGMEQ